jgi:hypothetical protein
MPWNRVPGGTASGSGDLLAPRPPAQPGLAWPDMHTDCPANQHQAAVWRAVPGGERPAGAARAVHRHCVQKACSPARAPIGCLRRARQDIPRLGGHGRRSAARHSVYSCFVHLDSAAPWAFHQWRPFGTRLCLWPLDVSLFGYMQAHSVGLWVAQLGAAVPQAVQQALMIITDTGAPPAVVRAIAQCCACIARSAEREELYEGVAASLGWGPVPPKDSLVEALVSAWKSIFERLCACTSGEPRTEGAWFSCLAVMPDPPRPV